MKYQFENKMNTKKGFTLIEILIAVVILGILATIGIGSFRTAQMRGRDTQRKSDLKQISNGLELYYSDYGRYPAGDLPWDAEFKDAKDTIYMKIVPVDPGGRTYVYAVSDTGSKFQLFAYLENTEDKNINPDITGVNCGVGFACNFSITSPNTTATESL